MGADYREVTVLMRDRNSQRKKRTCGDPLRRCVNQVFHFLRVVHD
jgi:hypothetical protein